MPRLRSWGTSSSHARVVHKIYLVSRGLWTYVRVYVTRSSHQTRVATMRRRIGSLRYHVDDGHATKTSLKKWIRVLSNGIAIIPTRLLCNASEVFWSRIPGTVSKFTKRKKISSSVVNVLHKKCEIRQFHVVVVQKCTKKRDVRAVLLFYLLGSLSSTFFERRTLTGSELFFSFDMPWRYQICIANCLYSCRDDLPKKSTFFDARPSRTSLRTLSVDYFESHIERFSYDREKWFR